MSLNGPVRLVVVAAAAALAACGSDAALSSLSSDSDGNPPPPPPGSFTGNSGPNTRGDGEIAPEDPPSSGPTNWIQLSTDDSTSMASAQLYRAGFGAQSLKPHEFVNYYDPAPSLFAQEEWPTSGTVGPDLEYGMEAHRIGDDSVELLFQMQSDEVTHQGRRNWNLFFCVDVSGSMGGDKIEFVRNALVMGLEQLKHGDRVTLITFDTYSYDVFIDLQYPSDRDEMVFQFNALQAGSSTNMMAGLNRTYELAQDAYDPGMLQRVIVFSDGDANVGDLDIANFERLTRINGQEGIYLSGVGVGYDFDWERMDRMTDAGKGAHVFLPNQEEVDRIFGLHYNKLIEVAADNIAIEMLLPEGVTLTEFSGEEVSINPEERLQNIVLASGDDMTFVARFDVSRPEAWDEPVTLELTMRPLKTGQERHEIIEIPSLSALVGSPGPLFERTRFIHNFGRFANQSLDPIITAQDLLVQLDALAVTDWGTDEIRGLLNENN